MGDVAVSLSNSAQLRDLQRKRNSEEYVSQRFFLISTLRGTVLHYCVLSCSTQCPGELLFLPSLCCSSSREGSGVRSGKASKPLVERDVKRPARSRYPGPIHASLCLGGTGLNVRISPQHVLRGSFAREPGGGVYACVMMMIHSKRTTRLVCLSIEAHRSSALFSVLIATCGLDLRPSIWTRTFYEVWSPNRVLITRGWRLLHIASSFCLIENDE